MMKKIINYICIAFFLLVNSAFVYSQVAKNITLEKNNISIENFTRSLKNLHGRFLTASAHSILLATTPSTANLVKFPHFSLGMQSSIAINNIETIRNLTKKLDDNSFTVKKSDLFESMPIFNWGFIPTLRFGIGGIPADVGLHVMYMPLHLDDGLDASKLSVGTDFRYAILKDENKKPGISVGIKYVYEHTQIQWNSDNLSLKTKNSQNKEIFIVTKRNKMNFDYSTHVISIPLQLSKLITFFEPYIGVEPFLTFGSLSLNFNTSPKVRYDNKLVDIQTYVRKVAKLKSNKSLILDSKGLRYTETSVNGGVRLYTGFAFKFWLFYLDTQFSYEPVHSEFGGSIGLRLQY